MVSYNARGLRQNNKRRRLFSYLHRRNAQIIMVQETHTLPMDEKLWQNEWGGQIIFSHGTHDSCGVFILFKPSFNVNILKWHSHDLGRYIIADIAITDKIVTIVCIYGPNLDNPTFFINLFQTISVFTCDTLIIGGDFNFVFSLDIDKKGGQQRTNFRARNECISFMTGLSLIDIWRERNPRTENFTWTSNITPGLYCRLDFFLISRHIAHSVSESSHSPGIQSDHSFVNLSLTLANEKRGPGYWKINNSLLSDPDYVFTITNTIQDYVPDISYSNPSSRWEGLKFLIRKDSIDFARKAT